LRKREEYVERRGETPKEEESGGENSRTVLTKIPRLGTFVKWLRTIVRWLRTIVRWLRVGKSTQV
jgi:hypothetical protein